MHVFTLHEWDPLPAGLVKLCTAASSAATALRMCFSVWAAVTTILQGPCATDPSPRLQDAHSYST